jgi:hypothetical protein
MMLRLPDSSSVTTTRPSLYHTPCNCLSWCGSIHGLRRSLSWRYCWPIVTVVLANSRSGNTVTFVLSSAPWS